MGGRGTGEVSGYAKGKITDLGEGGKVEESMAGPQVSHVAKKLDEAGKKLRGKRFFCAGSQQCLHLLKHAGGLQKSRTAKNCSSFNS
jgi:hypothetical protein